MKDAAQLAAALLAIAVTFGALLIGGGFASYFLARLFFE